MNYQVGASRVEMKFDAMGVVMLGWGDPNHKVKGQATPLYARTVAIKDPNTGKRLVMICLDSCFITEALRYAVVEELKKTAGIEDSEIIISATHTHSAPGGFSSYLVYSLSTNGFSPKIFDSYYQGCIQSANEALARMEPAEIRFTAGAFEKDKPVAFNRSVRSWNRNPDVQKHSRFERNLAVDREMQLLRFDRPDGTPIAVWNWFAVHCTSMHRDHYLMHSDNKGVAMTMMEDRMKKLNPEFVGVFANGAAGDVSPNFKYYLGIKEKRGADRKDETSCRINAALQSDHALRLFENAKSLPPLAVKLEGIFEYDDFSNITIDPEFAAGNPAARTAPAEVGISQLSGTAEGRGAPLFIIVMMVVSVRLSQLYNFVVDRLSGKKTRWPFTPDPLQGKKITVIASGRGEVLETSRVGQLIFPGFFHPTIASLKRWARRGVLKERPFTPQILPIQIACIGPIAIAAVPAEFTTVSGWRLRATVEPILKKSGIDRVVIQGYANAYSSYVVTPEEYAQQSYEGGCTHFGIYTLPGYQTVFKKLATTLNEKGQANSLRPKQPTPEYWETIKIH